MAKKKSPFIVLGQFNSTRNPDEVYTVKRHTDIPDTEPRRKHISCNCMAWRFSFKKLGYYDCKHTTYCREHPGSHAAVKKPAIDTLALALDRASVTLSPPQFTRLATELLPYLSSNGASAPELLPNTTTQLDDAVRVITLD